MRLIDLDTEVFVPIYDEAQGVTYEQIMTIGEMFDKFMGGYQPPIVDAIPVKWMRQKMWKPQITCVNPFGFVMDEWLDEQEAR